MFSPFNQPHQPNKTDLGLGNVDNTSDATKNAAAATLASKTLASPLITGPIDASAASAGQIIFPAAQNASAGANTLDDYEEGSWTPANANVTLTVFSAQYTKIGRLVQVDFKVQWPVTANASAAVITGLPFTVGSAASGCVGFNSSTNAVCVLADAGLTTIQIFDTTTGTARTNANMSNGFLMGTVVFNL